MAEKHPLAILPSDAPSNVTARKMTEAFHESGSEDLLLVVLTDDKGLSATRRGRLPQTGRHAAQRHQKRRDAAGLHQHAAAEVDRHQQGRQGLGAAGRCRGRTGHAAGPTRRSSRSPTSSTMPSPASSLKANLTGPAGTVADLTVAGQQDRMPIELAIGVLVLLVLLIVYRSAITMLLPLITIGLSLVIAQAVVAAYSFLTGAGVSNQSIVFLSAIMAGAGTDYAVFLISRYHDYLRLGREPRVGSQEGVGLDRQGDRRVGQHRRHHLPGDQLRPDGRLPDGRHRIGDRHRRGVPGRGDLAAGHRGHRRPRGWVKPRRELTARFWRRSGIRIVRRPRLHLVASLLVLALAGQLRGVGPLQLRRPQGAGSLGPELGRVHRAGSPLPGQPVDSGVHLHPVAARPAQSAGPRRPGADGGPDQPTAERRGDQRHHPSHRQRARTVPGHLSGGCHRQLPGRRVDPDQRPHQRPQPAVRGVRHAGRQTRRGARPGQPNSRPASRSWRAPSPRRKTSTAARRWSTRSTSRPSSSTTST